MSNKKCSKKPAPKGAKRSTGAKTASAKKAQSSPSGKWKSISALAAAQVLAASKEPLNARQLIEAMAAKGLWSSPGGKTPWATLYSAITREVATKGKKARFKKANRGQFTLA